MKNQPKWTRPLTDAQHYPLIYSVFERDAGGEGQKRRTFRIQDLHEERYEEAVNLMKSHHFTSDPMLSSKGITSDEASMKEIVENWRDVLEQKISIVCFEETSNEIVAMNFLSVITEEEFDLKPKSSEAEVCAEVKRVSKFIKDIFFNPFEFYKVESILVGTGIYVNEEFKDFDIAATMLKIRADIGKLLGIPVTSELFSTEVLQKAAAACDYDENFSIEYKKLPKLVCEGFFPGIREEKLKIMSKRLIK